MKNIEPHLDKDSSSKNEEDIQAHEKLQLTLEGIIGNIVISFNGTAPIYLIQQSYTNVSVSRIIFKYFV